MTESLYSGPLDYLVFTFPAGARVDAGLLRLFEAVDSGQIEVLDLEVVGRSADGHGLRLPLEDILSTDDAARSIFDGVESGLFDSSDLDAVAAGLEPGGFALALIYLEHSLDATAQAWIDAGGEPLLEGGIDPDDLATALETTATNSGSES